jgi:hypothetical protein
MHTPSYNVLNLQSTPRWPVDASLTFVRSVIHPYPLAPIGMSGEEHARAAARWLRSLLIRGCTAQLDSKGSCSCCPRSLRKSRCGTVRTVLIRRHDDDEIRLFDSPPNTIVSERRYHVP